MKNKGTCSTLHVISLIFASNLLPWESHSCSDECSHSYPVLSLQTFLLILSFLCLDWLLLAELHPSFPQFICEGLTLVLQSVSLFWNRTLKAVIKLK